MKCRIINSRRVAGVFIKTLVISLCFILPQSLFSNSNIDSLKSKLYNAKNDRSKMIAYRNLAVNYMINSKDSLRQALYYSEKFRKISKQLNLPKFTITSYKLTANTYRKIAKYDSSVFYLKKGIELANKPKFLKKKLGLTDDLSTVYMLQGKFNIALKLRQEILDSSIVNGFAETNRIKRGIAIIYYHKKEYSKAKKILLNTLGTNSFNNRMNYRYLGMAFKDLKQYDSAIYYTKLASESDGNRAHLQINSQEALAIIHLAKGDTLNAISLYSKILKKHGENSEFHRFNDIKITLSSVYLEKGDLDSALYYFKNVEIKSNKSNISETSHLGYVGYKLSKHEKDYKRALHFLEIYKETQDSLKDVEKNVAFKEIEGKYNIAKKEEEINYQKNKIKNLFILITGILFLLLLLIFYFRFKIKKTAYLNKISEQKLKVNKVEIESLKKENKIISLQSMIEGQEEERKRIAQDLHDNIGSLMAAIKIKVLSIQTELTKIENLNITSELDSMILNASQEIRRISHRITPVTLEMSGLEGAILDLETQLENKGIKLISDISELDLIKNKNIQVTIYRIIQESFNNIIKHSKANKVELKAKVTSDIISLIIKDNGIGMEKEAWENSKSLGLTSLKSRINFMNASIYMTNNNGLQYEIKIPIL